MTGLELWAGAECSVVRVGDTYVDQVELTGHAARSDDIDRLAELGIRGLRFPVLWERTAPVKDGAPAWAFADERLERLRALGIRPILGLVHHGSGPRHTSLLDESFVTGLAELAGMVAERYPWITDYTPVNEPLTTARFSALYGHWYPHARSAATFIRALLVQCRAIRAAMRAIRRVQPHARLVQTEDLGTVFARQRCAYQARFENHRRFASLDLLTGRLVPGHPVRSYFTSCGADEEELDSFVADPCPPQVIGLNHYVTSDRFLDERIDRYPPSVHGGNGVDVYADVEAVRVRGAGTSGYRALLKLLWARYRLPLAITEAHLGCTPEEQIRWLVEAWNDARDARASGADVCAVTAWSAFGAYDWDSLLTRARGHYESGLFDVRGGAVRPTALAQVAADLARTGASVHPMLAAAGWWRRPERLLYPAVGRLRPATSRTASRPILVTGGAGTLGRAVARVGKARGLTVVVLPRAQLDVSDPARVGEALDRYRPWAVVNAAGYVRVDEAEREASSCMRDNGEAASILAEACAARGIRLATFSSDLVFDGKKCAPYVESDAPNPLGAYGASKAFAERAVAGRYPDAIIARTSAFFGPWDEANFVHLALTELRAGRSFRAASDRVVSPTHVPDLADATLTLLVDGGSGLWHLANPGAMSWFELARAAASLAKLPTDRLVATRGGGGEGEGQGEAQGEGVARGAARPRYSVLASERGALLRPLDEALASFVEQWALRTPEREPVSG